MVRQVSTLSDRLVRRGHRVSFLALSTIDPTWRSLWTSDAVAMGSLLAKPPTNPFSAGLPLVGATVRLRRVLQEKNVDVVYALQGHLARLLAWIATRALSDTTLIWGARGSRATYTFRDDWKVALPFHLSRWVSASVPLLIANSDAGHAARRAGGYRCRELIAIPNGIDTQIFEVDASARSRVRSEWKARDERLVGLVARLHPRKGHRTFLDAAALVARQRDDVRFVLVGDGPTEFRRELEQYAQNVGLGDRLLWAGLREDMTAVYNALDVVCSASLAEGFPNVIGEAMACGVPCVVTDVGDSAAIVGDTGIVVPPGEPPVLADGLTTMLAKLDGLERLLVRDRIVRRFGVETMVEATESALARAARFS